MFGVSGRDEGAKVMGRDVTAWRPLKHKSGREISIAARYKN